MSFVKFSCHTTFKIICKAMFACCLKYSKAAILKWVTVILVSPCHGGETSNVFGFLNWNVKLLHINILKNKNLDGQCKMIFKEYLHNTMGEECTSWEISHVFLFCEEFLNCLFQRKYATYRHCIKVCIVLSSIWLFGNLANISEHQERRMF